MSPRFPRAGRVVVKVGSSSLRAPDGGLDTQLVRALVGEVAEARASGVAVVVVSSGAVAAGLGPLGLAQRPADLPRLQAAASVGQGLLMHTYQEAFAPFGVACGQVLLTPDDVVDRARYLNARRTFDTLLSLGAVPVVNENDTVATDELRFGDNDRLAALVASMLKADLLLLLSDVEGLLDGAPEQGAPRIPRVDDLSRLESHHLGPSGSAVGRGGMATKVEAARIAVFSGAHAVIAAARRRGVVAAVLAGEDVGTWFPPSRRRPDSRRLWIAFAHEPRGRLIIDAGAARALRDRGSSLLAAGVIDAVGAFGAGDPVEVVDPDGGVVARGLSAFAANDVRLVRGRSSAEIAASYGEAYLRAVIHRDQLVVVG